MQILEENGVDRRERGLISKLYMNQSGFAYPACNTYAPYCDVICGPFGFIVP
jgi:hypothetical protein